jgi:hypothetical protein
LLAIANEALAPPPAQPPRPQAVASSNAAATARATLRPAAAARNKVADVSLITPIDIVKMH